MLTRQELPVSRLFQHSAWVIGIKWLHAVQVSSWLPALVLLAVVHVADVQWHHLLPFAKVRIRQYFLFGKSAGVEKV